TGDWGMIKEGAKDVSQAYKDAWVNIGNDVVDGATETYNKVKENTDTALDNVLNGKREIITELFKVEPESVEEAKEGVISAVDEVMAGVASAMGGGGRQQVTAIGGVSMKMEDSPFSLSNLFFKDNEKLTEALEQRKNI